MLDPTFSQMSVSMYSTSADATSRLKLGGIFELDTNATSKVLFLEAMVKTDYQESAYEMVDGRQVVQYYVNRGFGVRIALQVLGWSSDVSLSFSAVAAKAQVSGQSVQYYVETLGMPDWLQSDILKAVGVAGSLNEESFCALRKVITVTLPAYLRRNAAESPNTAKGERPPLQFDDFRVPAGTSADTFDLSRSINFAMTHLARGDSLEQAKQALRSQPALLRDVGGDVIEEIYA